MRIFATGNTDADSSAEKESRYRGSSWSQGHRCVLVLAIIMALGLALRLVFQYGISAPDNYALSGGTNASSHLRVILDILAGTYNPGDQAQLNYPYGITSSSGPFYDYMMAAFAAIGGMFGVSNSVAAAGAMAWTSPIFGVLTAIPVFILARKLTSDGTVALVAAFIYTFTALVISVSPFSYGGEYALLGLLATTMACFIVSAFQAADEAKMAGFASIKDTRILFPALAAGALYGLVALTWSEFRIIPLVAGVMLCIHLIICRIKGRDIGVSVAITTVFLAVGTAIAAIYYIPSGLWTTVFMGGCMLAVFTIVYSLLFVLAEKKPWVITVPCFLAVIIAVAAILTVFVPDMSRAMFHNANLFADGLVRDLSEMFSRSSISSMAVWFGWITVWCPLFLGAYLLYGYRKNSGTRTFDLTVFGLLSMFFICWFTTGDAILAAPVMAIATSYVIVAVIRKVDMRGYLASLKTLRGSGLKGGLKKVFNFFPFVTLVVVVALVVAPNAISAFDAQTPTNDEKSGYFGGIGYTINTSDSSVIGTTWNNYSDVTKDGALLTWFGYSDSASAFGDFDVVTSPYGNGAQTMAVALMQSGSAGAIVAMTVRLLEDRSSDVIRQSVSVISSVDQAKFEKILKDPSYAESTLADTDFAGLRLDDGLRVNYAAFNYLYNELELNESELASIYDKTCSVTGDKISYIQVDSTMLPLAYGDGNSFSTIAYLGGYDVDSSGGVSGYCMMYSAFGYAYYYPQMYTSFAYQALLGCQPSYYGIGNSINYLRSLASSDGEYKPLPGYGLAGFEVEYWHVMYNPDKDATVNSPGWVDMNAPDAIRLQDENGGVINYLRSAVVMKYVGTGGSVFHGTVENKAGAPIPDVTVNVYATLEDFDPSEKISQVLYSTCVTDANGEYSVLLPVETAANSNDGSVIRYTGEYTIVYSTSADPLDDGNVFLTVDNSDTPDVTVENSSIYGQTIVGGDGKVLSNFDGSIRIVHSDGTTEYDQDINEGRFVFGNGDDVQILPGTYKATVYDLTGQTLFTTDLTVVPGEMEGITLKATTYKFKVTVNDQFSQPVGGVSVDVFDASGACIGSATTADDTTDDVTKGVATICLLPGKYTCRVADVGYFASPSAPVVITSSDKSVTISAMEAKELKSIVFDGIENPGVPVTIVSPEYTTVVPNSQDIGEHFMIPAPYGYLAEGYVATAYVNGEVYKSHGGIVRDGEGCTITLYPEETVVISGTVTNADGTAASNATVVLDQAYTVGTKQVFDYQKVTADENGKYKFSVVKGSEITVFAYNSDYAVKYAKETAAADTTVDLELAEGRNCTLTVSYYTGLSSPSTKGVLYYDDITAEVLTDGGVTYPLHSVMTDSSGKAHFIIPKGYTVNVKVGPTDTPCFYIGDKVVDEETEELVPKEIERTLFSNTTTSEYLYLNYNEPTSSDKNGRSYVKTVEARFDLGEGVSISGTLTPYKDIYVENEEGERVKLEHYDVDNNEINHGKQIKPGAYKLVVNKDCGYYCDDGYNVKFYTTITGSMVAVFEKPLFECYTVDVQYSNGDDLDIVTDGEYSYVDSNSVEYVRTYYIESGHNALISATDNDGKAAYVYTLDGREEPVDLTQKYELVTISGSINMSSATGTVSAAQKVGDEYQIFSTDISSGEYSLKVPGTPVGGTAFEYIISVKDLKATDDDGTTYKYTLEPSTITVGDKDVTYNFGVYTNESDPQEDKYVKFVSADMGLNDKGVYQGTVNLTLMDDKSVPGGSFYLIDGSDGFFLSKTYSMYVDENSEAPIRVVGTYNPFRDGDGSDAIAVNIKSVDGTVLKTIVIPAECFNDEPVGSTPKVELEVAGEESETYDSVNGYSYTYKIGIDNSDNNIAVKATVNASVISPNGGDWSVFVSFDGYNIYDLEELDPEEKAYYVIPGYGKATVSITLMSSDKFAYSDVPSIHYVVTVTDMEEQRTIQTEGASADGELQHKEGSVSETGSSVEGADNSPKKISVAFYMLLVFSVLVLLAFVYAANKRGVFSRR